MSFRQHVRAPRMAVYRALIDGAAIQRWRVPDGMTSQVHEYDAREGGRVRVSLTYTGEGAGKSGGRTDTYHGRFVTLVPGERVVEELEFETTDPAMQGRMTITFELRDASGGGTDVIGTHEGLPPGVREADNDLGWSMALRKLAALVEATA
jgi:uncharacterized protein YndB with AHSA1/START domain